MKQDSDLHGKRSCDHSLEADSSDTATPDILSSGAMTPDPFGLGLNAPNNSNHGTLGVFGSLNQELTTKLKELTSQVRETQLSSTEDELDRYEYQTETKGVNQSRRTEVLGVDDRTDGNKMIQYDEKTQNYVEMVEKVEEERSEKRQKDTLAKQGVSEQNGTSETQMSEEMSSMSQKQTLETDAQNEIIRERIEETKNKGEVHTEEKKSEIKDCGNAVEGQQSRAESTETVDHIEEQEVLSCELALNRLISEDGKMEFDRIINTVVKALDDMEEHIESYTSEGVFLDRERSEGEKHEMMEEEENVTEQETDDSTISEGCFVGGKSKEVQEKEMKEEGKINEVVALKSNTEYTEDKQCSKSSEERVQEKDGKSQGDLTENREKQRDSTIEHSTPSGQEYLSPEEIYKVTTNYSILY